MPKARKDYKCSLCELIIPVGSEYHQQRVIPDGIYNDLFGTARSHVGCHETWIRNGDVLDWEYPGVDEFRAMMPAAASPNAAELADKVL